MKPNHFVKGPVRSRVPDRARVSVPHVVRPQRHRPPNRRQLYRRLQEHPPPSMNEITFLFFSRILKVFEENPTNVFVLLENPKNVFDFSDFGANEGHRRDGAQGRVQVHRGQSPHQGFEDRRSGTSIEKGAQRSIRGS